MRLLYDVNVIFVNHLLILYLLPLYSCLCLCYCSLHVYLRIWNEMCTLLFVCLFFFLSELLSCTCLANPALQPNSSYMPDDNNQAASCDDHS